MRSIYLDHAATTPLCPEALEAMAYHLSSTFGNPSSLHRYGRQARAALDDARDRVAACLGCHSSEIVFTSGGTEADNLAILGAARASRGRSHLVTSAIEHHAVLHPAERLREEGWEVTLVPVTHEGLVDLAELEAAVTDRTALVSVMMANNEIGTLQPVEAVARLAHDRGALFHTDAVQVVGSLPVDLSRLPVDLLSFAAHKFHGPRGAGGLYVRKGTRLHPHLLGGAQERERRAGTENLPALVGMAAALERACRDLSAEAHRQTLLRDRLIEGVLTSIPGSRLNGHRTCRLPNNANFAFEGVDGEALLLNLDLEGIACSSGSACTSGALDPSHVLLALGLPRPLAEASLRLTLGRSTTDAEIDETLEVLAATVERLRALGS